MKEFILLIHSGATDQQLSAVADGQFEGGNMIGAGQCFRKGATAAAPSPICGYIKVQASDIDGARRLLEGNPVYEAGGTVEIKPLGKLLQSEPVPCNETPPASDMNHDICRGHDQHNQTLVSSTEPVRV